MKFSSTFMRCLLGLTGMVAAGAASAQSPREVTIGLSSNSMGAAAFRLCKELGFFEKHGLQARLITTDSGSSVTTALISGSIQFATSSLAELISANTRGMQLVAITNTYGGLSGTMVLAKSVVDKLGVKADAPVKDRIKALDGLVIASTTVSSPNTVGFQLAAKANGATIRSVYMAQDAMPAALQSGAVQGFTSATPFWSFPVTAGTAVVWLSAPNGDLPREFTTSTSNTLMTTRAFAEAHADLVRQVDAVYQDLVKAIKERPGDVKAAIGKLYPSLTPSTIDLLFAAEATPWSAKPLTTTDVANDIAFMKKSSVNLPGLDQLDPASVLWKIQ